MQYYGPEPDPNPDPKPPSYWQLFDPRQHGRVPPVPESKAEISANRPESYAQFSANQPGLPAFTKQEKNYWQLVVNLVMIPLWAVVFWPVAVVWLVVVLFVWSSRQRQRSRDKWLVENLRRQNNSYGNGGGDVF